MKDLSQQTLEAERPEVDVADALHYVLRSLYKDKTKTIGDEVVHGLTFEELIGALLLSRDLVEEFDRLQKENDVLHDDLSICEIKIEDPNNRSTK